LKYPLPFFFLEFQAGFHSHKRNEELVPFLVFFFVDALISISFLFPLLLDTVGRLRSNEDTRARVERQKEGPPGRFEGAVSGGRTGVRCLLLSGPIWGIRILGGYFWDARDKSMLEERRVFYFEGWEELYDRGSGLGR
jgi:hypothetical protein